MQPFYSNLEVMDFLASQKMNILAQRQDKSKVLHRDEREYMRRRARLTPDLNSNKYAVTNYRKKVSKLDVSLMLS